MRLRPLAATALATAVLVAIPLTAQAKQTEMIDRRTFDPAATVTSSTIHVAGDTAGELGGHLDLTVTAQDGSLPSGNGECDPVDVAAAWTVSPGERLDVRAAGEVCMHPFATTLTLNAYFGNDDVTYTGEAHKKVRMAGDGMVGASNSLGFGFGASIFAPVRW